MDKKKAPVTGLFSLEETIITSYLGFHLLENSIVVLVVPMVVLRSL
jgi:hypothetical protein